MLELYILAVGAERATRERDDQHRSDWREARLIDRLEARLRVARATLRLTPSVQRR